MKIKNKLNLYLQVILKRNKITESKLNQNHPKHNLHALQISRIYSTLFFICAEKLYRLIACLIKIIFKIT